MAEKMRARVIRVRVDRHGGSLATAAAVGATTLAVKDAGDFTAPGTLQVDDDAGTLLDYTDVTLVEDTDPTDLTTPDTITLAAPLAVAIPAPTALRVYEASTDGDDPVVAAVIASCIPEGDDDAAETGEPLRATVPPDKQDDLPPGRFPDPGVPVVLEWDDDEEEWFVARFRGKGSRTIKFEDDDAYVLTGGTGGDIEAGVATIPLSHKPVDESVKLWWRTVAQEPTEYTVDADAQTITLPLIADCRAGDRVWVHYAYRTDLAKPDPVGTTFSLVGSAGNHNTSSTTSAAFPAGSQAGDLFVYACITRNGYTNACPDSRAALAVDQPLAGNYTTRVWTGTVTDPTTPLSVNNTGTSGNFEFAWQLMVIRPAQPVPFNLAKISDSGDQGPGGVGTIPGLTGVSGAVGVGFSTSVSGAGNHTWPSPWGSVVTTGGYERVSIALQVGMTVGSTPALTPDYWRGFAIGVGLVT